MTVKPPAQSQSPTDQAVEKASEKPDIDAFLAAAKRVKPRAAGAGRLIFAMDATMSRQPTWDRACHLQGEMFAEADRIGDLDIQLIYFRGFGECAASKWASDARTLGDLMSRISCRGGHTQIGKVLSHAIKETRRNKVQALVYVGDCMEESVDDLCAKAGELGLLGVPAFVFQEGREPVAEQVFREIARLTNGAFCRFDSASARQLGDLLRAVAAFAAGGRQALSDMRDRGAAGARLLLEQMR